IWVAFCQISGLILAPTLLALALASVMGILPPLDRVRELLANAEAPAESDEPIEVAEADIEPAPADAPYWERRLSRVGRGISRDRAELEARATEVEAKVARVDGLTRALGPLLESTLGEAITEADILTRSDELQKKLQRLASEEERFPALLETARTMSAKSLAKILAPEGANAGAEERARARANATKLLRAMEPRTSGKVLEAMAKIDPAYALELVESIGGPAIAESTEGK
ncbi:MAG: hypothetical protein AAF488_02385, partial [Planctomycetota bacterium]